MNNWEDNYDDPFISQYNAICYIEDTNILIGVCVYLKSLGYNVCNAHDPRALYHICGLNHTINIINNYVNCNSSGLKPNQKDEILEINSNLVKKLNEDKGFYKDFIDCKDNYILFQHVASLTTKHDNNQWFITTNKDKEYWFYNTRCPNFGERYKDSYRKATLEDLINKFK